MSEEEMTKVAHNLANNDDFISEKLMPLLTPLLELELKTELTRHLSKEKRILIGLSLGLAIGSPVALIVVYWQNLLHGETDAVKMFAIGALFLIILVINTTFIMTVFRVTR